MARRRRPCTSGAHAQRLSGPRYAGSTSSLPCCAWKKLRSGAHARLCAAPRGAAPALVRSHPGFLTLIHIHGSQCRGCKCSHAYSHRRSVALGSRRAKQACGDARSRPHGAPARGSYYRNLVDPASSRSLVSKIKPCMSKYKQDTVKLRMAHYISYNLFDGHLLG